MKRGALHCVSGLAGAIALVGCARGPVAATPQRDDAAPASLAVDVYGSGAPAASASAALVVAFRVLAADDPGAPDRVVAAGRTGEGAVAVPPGVVVLAVDLDPPERVGPFRLDAGAAAHVRILDTFDAALPSRIWRLERGDEVVGREFPPPDELPAASAP